MPAAGRFILQPKKRITQSTDNGTNFIRSSIEAVITRRTRNPLALRGPWVRIPPAPPNAKAPVSGAFLMENNDRNHRGCFLSAILFLLCMFNPQEYTGPDEAGAKPIEKNIAIFRDSIISHRQIKGYRHGGRTCIA